MFLQKRCLLADRSEQSMCWCWCFFTPLFCDWSGLSSGSRADLSPGRCMRAVSAAGLRRGYGGQMELVCGKSRPAYNTWVSIPAKAVPDALTNTHNHIYDAPQVSSPVRKAILLLCYYHWYTIRAFCQYFKLIFIFSVFTLILVKVLVNCCVIWSFFKSFFIIIVFKYDYIVFMNFYLLVFIFIFCLHFSVLVIFLFFCNFSCLYSLY